MLFKQANERISTGQLNRLVKAAIERHEPPLYQLKRPKIYYATQITSLPPTIILVCNQPQGFPTQYQRYLLTFLRDHLPFGEIPIKLYLQPRARDDERDDLSRDSRRPDELIPAHDDSDDFPDHDEDESFDDDDFEEEDGFDEEDESDDYETDGDDSGGLDSEEKTNSKTVDDNEVDR